MTHERPAHTRNPWVDVRNSAARGETFRVGWIARRVVAGLAHFGQVVLPVQVGGLGTQHTGTASSPLQLTVGGSG